VVEGSGSEGAGYVGDQLLDVDAIIEARDVDLRSRTAGGGVAAEIASVRVTVELAADGDAAAGESVGLDVAAVEFSGCFGGRGGHGCSVAGSGFQYPMIRTWGIRRECWAEKPEAQLLAAPLE
jgi:hypothetical protein